VLLGFPSAALLFIVSFFVGGYVFHDVFLAIAGVYLIALLGALLGWILGAYPPTLLSLLAQHKRLDHWAASVLLTTFAGALLFSTLRWLGELYGPSIAYMVSPFLQPFLIPPGLPGP